MTAPHETATRPTLGKNPSSSPELARLGLRSDRIAFGLAGIGGAWGPVDPGLARETLRQALELGIQVFDAAPSYGTAEKLMGEALVTWRGPPPIISTKIGRLPARDGHEVKFDFTSAGLRESLERSLATFGVPRVDLLFLHEPDYVPLNERGRVVEAMRLMKADGLVSHLGVAGGHGVGWDGYLETGAYDVIMLFRRLDACIFDGVVADVPRLRRAGLAIYGASPLHMGLLGSRHDEFVNEPRDWVWTDPVKRAIRLRALAEKTGMSLAMLAHRFIFSVAEIDRIVIGARSPEELVDAWNAWKAGPLSPELFNAVCAAHD